VNFAKSTYHALHKKCRNKQYSPTSPIPPLINPHLQVLLSLNIATDNRPRSAGILIRKQSSLFLHIVLVFVVSKET